MFYQALLLNNILKNPPFNVSDWGGERLQNDIRWKYGIPPVGNANFAWLQHIFPRRVLPHLPVLLFLHTCQANTSNEGNIRKNMIIGDVVECIVAMPSQLFYSTGIPVSLWIFPFPCLQFWYVSAIFLISSSDNSRTFRSII